MKDVAVIDFETYPIGPRPEAYPPAPVGVAIREPGKRSRYFGWAHPTGNNCDVDEAHKVLKRLYSRYAILCHNAAFDLEVAHEHMGLPLIPRYGVHDTTWLAFLDDPNQESVALKDLAHEQLNIPPDEQLALRDWIYDHIKGAKRLKKHWAKYIYQAPGTLVGRYAKADADMTWKLFKHYCRRELHLLPGYTREQRLLPLLLEMGREGIPVNQSLLEETLDRARADLAATLRWLRRRLGDINFDSVDELVPAIEKVDKKFDGWMETKSGQESIAIESMRACGVNPGIVGALELRGALSNAIKIHLAPWNEQSAFTGGTVHCTWNSVPRPGADGGSRFGARTGRLSSTPNTQNIRKRLQQVTHLQKAWMEQIAKGKGCILVPAALKHCRVPDLRSCVAAPRGLMLCGADYSGQELRILAHFAGGSILEHYQSDPDFDLHGMVGDVIAELTGIELTRTHTKNTVFGRLYGAAIGRTADQIGADWDTAQAVRRSLDAAIPTLPLLDSELKAAGGCLTWGGRWNPVEPSTFVGDRWMDFGYKLINTLIQGSAADVTKEAMVRYYEDPDREGRLVLSVHDELLAIAPTKRAKSELKLMRGNMESVEMKCAMPTDGGVGKNWRAAA